jgi:Dihydrofolate reductase
MDSFSYYTFSKPVKYITFAMIMAVDNRGAIGVRNGLPWDGFINNKLDMEWFKDHTKGKVVIMGYNTWVSLGRKPLPGRVNIVVTGNHIEEVTEDIKTNMGIATQAGKVTPRVIVAQSPEKVIEAINHGMGDWNDGGEMMVIGGAKIYEAFMPHTSRIYLTTFDGEFEADTFVHLDLTDFDLIYRDKMRQSELNFEIWDVTEAAAKRDDADIMKIEHVYREADGIAAEIMKERAEKKDV